MAGAADALHAGGDGGRRLDLNDEVDRAHVDAQLERRSRDDGANPTGLELVFDLGALGGGEGAVVGAGEGFLREVVDESGKAFGGAAVVDKDEGGLALADDREKSRGDGRPDGSSFRGGVRGPGGVRFRRLEIFNRDFNSESEAFGGGGVDDRHGARRKSRPLHSARQNRSRCGRDDNLAGAAEKAGDFFEGALGG